MTMLAEHDTAAGSAPRSFETRRARVAVVETFALVAEAIGLTLSRTGSCTPVPVTIPPRSTTLDACHSVLRTRADIAVVSLTRGGVRDPLTLVETLSAEGMSLIITGPTVDDESARLYRAAGAVSARQDSTVAEVVDLVAREVHRHRTSGRVVRARAAADRGWTRDREPVWDARRHLGRLAPAEARILGHLMQGRTVDDIARLHVVSVATVRTQISRILAKLEVSSQLSAVALAWQSGWEPSLEPEVA